MKLLFKQRFFSWFDSYDIFDEYGETVYTVKGQLSLGHCLFILDKYGNHIATVKEKILSFLPRFYLYVGDNLIGTIKKEFTFFRPSFSIDFNGWSIDGSFWEWNYEIMAYNGNIVATISKEIFHMTDTYVIDVKNNNDALYALMVVLAIDAEKSNRQN